LILLLPKHLIKIIGFSVLIIIISVVTLKNWPQKFNEFASLLSSNNKYDSLEFAPNHPNVNISALVQLRQFPAPQFKENHGLLPNFLWMDPSYMAGLLQPKYKMKECVKLSTQIQAELAFNWHYYFLVSNNLKIYRNYNDTNTFGGAWVKYANLHPELKCGAISFWAQVQPFRKGGNCTAKSAYVGNKELPDCCYVHNENNEIISKKHMSPIMPVEALICDFQTQSMYVDSLLNSLKRPLHIINENGETFRLYHGDELENDNRIVAEKDKYPSLNWNEFQAMKRLEKELAFKNAFMSKAALSNCLYTEYSIDGQNKYRHDYKTMRVVNSKINHQYYSTPDFYPRYPNNWRDWKGPWHGLKWLEICRKTEIDLGDNLFSPFVAAGWDSIEANNIRPAQWLGLLKILGTLGAEFYYSGFFNTGKSVAKPENYIWQAVMPVYAQGITSFYEEILRNGKINSGENLIQYAADDVPFVIRKNKAKKEWIIACSWQTGSNLNKNIGESKIVSVNLGHKKLKVIARRQGSVYYYSEENSSTVFYQLDGWHEYMHPYYWSKNIKLEAELYLNNVHTDASISNDYTKFTTFASLNNETSIPFQIHGENNNIKSLLFWIKNDEIAGSTDVYIDEVLIGTIKADSKKVFNKFTLFNPKSILNLKNGKHLLKLKSQKGGLKLDKIEIEII
jgi:hypothetical protein